MKFPQYRKYKNLPVYFKIDSENSFEELKIMNKKYFLHHIIAHQYPEKLRIQDMLLALDDHYEIITSEEYHETLTETKKTKEAF